MKIKRKKSSGNFYTLKPVPKTYRCGFTLIELLIVIAVIALLLSILVPSLSKARSIAYRLRCASNLKQIDLAVRLYLGGNDDFYPCDVCDPLPNGFWLWMGRGWRSFVEPYIGGNIDANNPSALFCPQDKNAKNNYESTSYAYSMAFYHSPEQIDDMNNPSYTCGKGPSTHIPQRSLNVVKPAGKILAGEWNSNHLRVVEQGWYGYGGWWCWEGNRNYLFADGQVQFLKAEDIRPANDGYPNPSLTNHGIRGIDWPK